MRVFVRALISVSLAFGVGSMTVVQASAESIPDGTEVSIPTHFYGLGLRGFTGPSPFPWVTEGPGGRVLALGADEGLGANPRQGGTALTYPVTVFDPASGAFRSAGDLDLSPAVSPGSRVRILDFLWSPLLGDARSTSTATALVSFASFEPSTACRRLQVFRARIDLQGTGTSRMLGSVYRLPCLKVVNDPDTGIPGPVLHQSGGRLLVSKPALSGKRPSSPLIYLSIGDFQVLANKARQLPLNLRQLLGTVVEVGSNGRPTIVTRGLRNPQGLTLARLDGKEQVLASSHGPRGGDELVQIAEGRNYGWPRESYGTVYDVQPTPMQSKPRREGRVQDSAVPLFAWLPSIGPSAILQNRGAAFRQWWGSESSGRSADLILSGMGTQSLYRLRWQAGSIRYVEEMKLGMRVRSLTQLRTGVLVAGTDEGQVVVIRPVTRWSSPESAFVP